ncbi:hypothetical protein ACFOZ0_09765 [Streptomyces yaanensis]|uniref:Uncharacterized protein n=1 Tax=Streptomyces yaanensis TaxID=1142239 RepID=A0ABV7SBH1_9ACTN|nr:hypothetical protein [Streptomyces sp. CGMCC 4.7035]WNB96643.1 hypothetical protein Q2K21_00355 [Streptomyces sp. CGMCC 4.7035]
MPRDIDDQVRRRDRDRDRGEITSDEIRDRDRRDPDKNGSEISDPATRREHPERRSSWDDDDEDMQEGYR